MTVLRCERMELRHRLREPLEDIRPRPMVQISLMLL